MKSSDKEMLIKTVWADGSTSALHCIICDNNEEKPHVISTPHVFQEKNIIHFYKCDQCGSLCAEAPVFTDYDDKKSQDENLLETQAWMRHYFQLGAGIQSMIEPVIYSGLMPDKTFLDVGCGFGFTLDYWDWRNGKGAYGCEPSNYGKLGKKILRANISVSYLAEAPTLKALKFDRILSSEVIEHVDNPLAFINELHDRLQDNGVLVLTTPYGDYIQQHNPLTIMLAALNPGLHRVLFSRQAMAMLLQKAGFKHVEVKVKNERLVAYASDQPLDITETEEDLRHSYIAYLRDRSQKNYIADMKLGFLFRLFKECVNDGQHKNLQNILSDIHTIVQQEYAIDIFDVQQLSDISSEITEFHIYGQKFPFFISVLIFYIAMAQRRSWIKGDSEQTFSICTGLLLDAYSLSPNYFQEPASLYWQAVYETGAALLANGKKEEAITWFDKILNQSVSSDIERTLELKEFVRLNSLRDKAVAVLQLGEPEAAMGYLRKFIHQSDFKMRKQAVDLYKIAQLQAEQEVAPFLKPTKKQLSRLRKLYKKIHIKLIGRYGQKHGKNKAISNNQETVSS